MRDHRDIFVRQSDYPLLEILRPFLQNLNGLAPSLFSKQLLVVIYSHLILCKKDEVNVRLLEGRTYRGVAAHTTKSLPAWKRSRSEKEFAYAVTTRGCLCRMRLLNLRVEELVGG